MESQVGWNYRFTPFILLLYKPRSAFSQFTQTESRKRLCRSQPSQQTPKPPNTFFSLSHSKIFTHITLLPLSLYCFNKRQCPWLLQEPKRCRPCPRSPHPHRWILHSRRAPLPHCTAIVLPRRRRRHLPPWDSPSTSDLRRPRGWRWRRNIGTITLQCHHRRRLLLLLKRGRACVPLRCTQARSGARTINGWRSRSRSSKRRRRGGVAASWTLEDRRWRTRWWESEE